MSTNYIPSLDGIRAVSVIIVLLSHAGFGHVIPGGLGVTTFFFLSGYLISTLLIKEYVGRNRIHLSHFYLRRFFRLSPPLFVFLLVAYVFSMLNFVEGGVSWQGFFHQVFYLANYHHIYNWAGETPSGTVILWSLAVEEHFYLIFPALLFVFFRFFSKTGFIYFLVFLCLSVLLWRLNLSINYEVHEDRIYYATDTRIDSILFGCLLALTANPAVGVSKKAFAWREWGLVGISLMLIMFSLLYRNETFRDSFRFTLQGIALMPLFYLSVRFHKHWLFSWLNIAMIRKLGVYSYSIYLFHHLMIYTLEHSFGIREPILVILWSFTISVGAAYLIDRYVDGYFLNLRKRFR